MENVIDIFCAGIWGLLMEKNLQTMLFILNSFPSISCEWLINVCIMKPEWEDLKCWVVRVNPYNGWMDEWNSQSPTSRREDHRNPWWIWHWSWKMSCHNSLALHHVLKIRCDVKDLSNQSHWPKNRKKPLSEMPCSVSLLCGELRMFISCTREGLGETQNDQVKKFLFKGSRMDRCHNIVPVVTPCWWTTQSA